MQDRHEHINLVFYSDIDICCIPDLQRYHKINNHYNWKLLPVDMFLSIYYLTLNVQPFLAATPFHVEVMCWTINLKMIVPLTSCTPPRFGLAPEIFWLPFPRTSKLVGAQLILTWAGIGQFVCFYCLNNATNMIN